MILHRLALRNFKSYRAVDIEFPTQGLIGVIGANGAGKSSLFDALLFALYGKMPFDKEMIRTAGAPAKEPVEVETEFSVRGERYRVRRELRGKALTHKATLLDEGERVLAEQDKPVSEQVARLLGLDETAFVRSVFARQKELAALSSDQGEVRKSHVRRMLGLDRIDEAHRAAKTDQNDLQKIIEGMQSALLDEPTRAALHEEITIAQETARTLDEQIAQADAAVKHTRQAYQDAEKSRDALQTRKDEREKIERQKSSTQARAEANESSLTALQNELDELKAMEKESVKLAADEQTYQAAVREKDALIAARERFNRREALMAQRTEREKNLTQANEELTRRKAAREAMGEVDAALAAVQTQNEKATADFKQAQAKERAATKTIAAIRERINERERKRTLIETLGEQAKCPTCNRPLEGDYRHILDEMADELRALQEQELRRAQDEHDEILAKLQQAEDDKKKADEAQAHAQQQTQLAKAADSELAKAQRAADQAIQNFQIADQALRDFGEAPFDAAALTAAQAQVSGLQSAHERYAALTAKLERRESVERDLADNEKLREELRVALAAFTEQLNALPFDENELRAAAEASQMAAQAMNDAVRILGEHKSERGKIDATIDERRHRLARDDKQRQTVAERLARLEDLAACVEALRTFRTAALAHVTPEIDRLASALFARVTRGRYPRIHVTDDFEFVITDDGAAYPIKRFSGGEIALANLCLRVAVGRVVAHLHGRTAPGLLAFDEIFGSQDDDRRTQLLEALLQLEGQVLVISHQDAVKDDFLHALLVRRDGDSSTAAWL